jgi:hypothetical protein
MCLGQNVCICLGQQVSFHIAGMWHGQKVSPSMAELCCGQKVSSSMSGMCIFSLAKGKENIAS